MHREPLPDGPKYHTSKGSWSDPLDQTPYPIPFYMFLCRCTFLVPIKPYKPAGFLAEGSSQSAWHYMCYVALLDLES